MILQGVICKQYIWVHTSSTWEINKVGELGFVPQSIEWANPFFSWQYQVSEVSVRLEYYLYLSSLFFPTHDILAEKKGNKASSIKTVIIPDKSSCLCDACMTHQLLSGWGLDHFPSSWQIVEQAIKSDRKWFILVVPPKEDTWSRENLNLKTLHDQVNV